MKPNRWQFIRTCIVAPLAALVGVKMVEKEQIREVDGIRVYGTDAQGKPISEWIPVGGTSKLRFHTFAEISKVDSSVGSIELDV